MDVVIDEALLLHFFFVCLFVYIASFSDMVEQRTNCALCYTCASAVDSVLYSLTRCKGESRPNHPSDISKYSSLICY